MARAEEVVSIQPSTSHRRIEQEDLLLFVGGVYDDQIKRTDASLSANDMLQDLLHVEASFMRLNIISAQKRSTNDTQQKLNHFAKKHPQRSILSSRVEFTSFKMEEHLFTSRGLLGKAHVAIVNGFHVNRPMNADPEAENGRDVENGEDADNWSMVAERSQGRN